MIINIVHMWCLNYLIIRQWFLGRVFLEKVIGNFKEEGYNFNHIAEMNIITIAKKLDMTYDFYIKHNMCALEWKLNGMINKDKVHLLNFIVNGNVLWIEILKILVFD